MDEEITVKKPNTTIKLSNSTRDIIRNLKEKRETYEDVILRVLNERKTTP